MKNMVALYDIVLNIFYVKPSNDEDITELSVLDSYAVTIKHLELILNDNICPNS